MTSQCLTRDWSPPKEIDISENWGRFFVSVGKNFIPMAWSTPNLFKKFLFQSGMNAHWRSRNLIQALQHEYPLYSFKRNDATVYLNFHNILL